MKIRAFLRSIRESFTTILGKYHCKNIIMPLFSLVLLLNALSTLNSSAISPSIGKIKAKTEIETVTKTKTKTEAETVTLAESQKAEDDKSLKKIKVVSLPKDNPKTTYNSGSTAKFAKTKTSTPASKPAATPVASAVNTMSIAGHVLPIFYSSNTAIDAGSRVARYGNYFYYGHRSTVFGFLASLPIGTQFTINLGGNITTYRIARIVTLDNSITDTEGKTEAKRYMSALVSGRFQGASYGAILMTCAGASLPGGDATARTVVLATAI